jgi:glucokinase
MTQLIGVDVGGTKVSVAALEGAELTGPHIAPTDQSEGGQALIDQIVRGVEEIRGPEAAAVGVGVPSVVEFATGRVRSSVNIPLKDVPLRRVLTERLGLPVFVDNDATVAALAEAHDESGRTANNLVMFTIGTGVGGGLVLGGRIYRGSTGAAPEMGHTLIGLDLRAGAPRPGRFPQPGSLEALAAGRALDELGAETAEVDPGSALARVAAAGEKVTGHHVVEAAQGGDVPARRLLTILGERLGVGIANAINLFDPDEVVIGGGVAVAGDLLLEPARETALGYVVPGVGERTVIRLARWGVEAGVRGAALLAGQEAAH